MRRSNWASESLAGPIVQTIFAFRMQNFPALDKMRTEVNDACLPEYSLLNSGIRTERNDADYHKSTRFRDDSRIIDLWRAVCSTIAGRGGPAACCAGSFNRKSPTCRGRDGRDQRLCSASSE